MWIRIENDKREKFGNIQKVMIFFFRNQKGLRRKVVFFPVMLIPHPWIKCLSFLPRRSLSFALLLSPTSFCFFSLKFQAFPGHGVELSTNNMRSNPLIRWITKEYKGSILLHDVVQLYSNFLEYEI